MNFKSKLLKGLLAVCLTINAASAQITNGSFNTTNFTGWTTSGGCTGGGVGNMTGGPEIYNGMGGNWWADLTGCGWGNGRWIQQDVPTVIGQTYFLSFDLGSWNGQCFTDAGVDLYINTSFINRYSHATFTGSWLAWQRFQYCFVATSTLTNVKFVGNGWGTALTPSWANTGGSYTGVTYEYSGVIGLDSIQLDTLPVHILASDTCAPAQLICSPGSINGNINWYFNGSLYSAGGPDTIVGSTPGIYKLEYITPCGTFTVEKTLVHCDTCITPPVHILASDTCAPAQLICSPGSTNGTINWYFNGSLISSGGPDTIVGSTPGVYKLEYITPCGTFTVEKTLVHCDTCIIEMTSAYYCLGDSTIFWFNPPVECLDPKCIGDVWIDYGDGSPMEFSPNGPARFSHQYAAPGTYRVKYCWTNNCTGERICKDFTITIAPCEGCRFQPDFNFDNCIPTQFNNTTITPHPIVSIHWDFGDGNSSSVSNPLHAYASPGTYYVCLTIVVKMPDGKLCSKTFCRWVEIIYCDVVPDRKKAPSIGKPINSNFDFEKESMPGVTIFPNPGSEDVSISSIVFRTPGMNVYIYDISGRLLFTEALNSGKKEVMLPTKNLDPGTYLIKVKGHNYTKDLKFVKE